MWIEAIRFVEKYCWSEMLIIIEIIVYITYYSEWRERLQKFWTKNK